MKRSVKALRRQKLKQSDDLAFEQAEDIVFSSGKLLRPRADAVSKYLGIDITTGGPLLPPKLFPLKRGSAKDALKLGRRVAMSDPRESFEPLLILPVGTQIVTRTAVKAADGSVLYPRGSVAVIIEALPDQLHHYRVRFPTGGEHIFSRQEFAVRKHLRETALQNQRSNVFADLSPFVIYRCIVGSRAYGLDNEDSDVDRRGIYLASAELQWSLNGAPEQLESESTQETYWELQKFLMMALKANPNVLECLYTPLVEYKTPLVDELLAMRSIFLSRFVYQTYNGYVLSQFKQLERDLRTKGEPRWKHAMHLIRLLLSGITLLTDGSVMVRVTEHREQLLRIKRAEMSWGEVNTWRLSLHAEFDRAYAQTTLPEHPDYEQADAFLI